ncbi:MAG: exo-alpha-sialidase, partial [Candidatus Latescibacteria bacterium]|nr:exo-alpha-sialidase [Candidatus Latescibacterota bacterium]
MNGRSDPFHISEFSKRTIYHSPQTPGYTCWVGIWNMPDESTMISFTQATGPLEGRPKAPPEVRERLTWPPKIAGETTGVGESYDMTGLDLRNVHLRTRDGGATWDYVSADRFESCMNGCAGEAETALPDGTILRSVWGFYLPYGDLPQTGFIERSTDGSKTWGPPVIVIDPEERIYMPKRIRVLRDGRLIMTGAVADVPAASMTRAEWQQYLRPILLVSEDNGRTWMEPLEVLPEALRIPPYPGEEYDAAELPNGDLLLVFRWAVHDPSTGKAVREERRQSVLKKTGTTWKLGPVRSAPFPHSGHPELLATREGPILHLATSGISWTTDGGAHWHDAEMEGAGYYPRAVQLPDGRILCVYHDGGDDAYGD